ncbi:MAG: restriction endonuclease subunit S [Candidatus Cryptobacteroides sp.]
MAKQLYDYWFVQFDFPDENGRPYKSSGGKMVWNEKLKRDIPEGWICCQLDEIESNIVTGKTPSTTDESYFGGEIPFITIDDIRQARYVFQTTRTLSEKGANTQSKKYLPVGALCCSCIGTVGLLGFAGKIGQTNQQINSIVFKQDYNREYLYFSLHLYFSHASAKVGNILPNMSKDDFSKIPLLYPTKSLVMKYHQTTQNIFHQIENSITEINILTKQRDELLPLLMNGQVSVNNDLSVYSAEIIWLILHFWQKCQECKMGKWIRSLIIDLIQLHKSLFYFFLPKDAPEQIETNIQALCRT